jgi:hypothetical protein
MINSRLSRFNFLPFYLLLFFVSGPFGWAAQSVTLYWDRNSEPDIAGYRLYYGPTSAPYNQLLDVQTTSVNVANLVDGVTYLFAVTAYNSAGTESAFSTGFFAL